jgi:hypothetical protein
MSIKSKLKEQYDYIDDLSQKRKKSIEDYTGDYYDSINSRLLYNLPMLHKEEAIVKDLDYIFANVPPITSSIILYRGVTKKHPFGVLPGFISTSYEISEALGFTNTNEQCCVFIISIPIGAKVLPIENISLHKLESEILLPRSSNFVVTGDEIRDDMEYFHLKLIIGDLEEVPKEKSPEKKLDNKAIIRLLIENTPNDEIELFGIEIAIKNTASLLKDIVGENLSDDVINSAVRCYIQPC